MSNRFKIGSHGRQGQSQPINSVSDYVTNKTAKIFDYVFTASPNGDRFYTAADGFRLSIKELDGLHPTDQNLFAKPGLDSRQQFMK